ncbi:MAG: hypothetical protein HY904_07555 [Deltaproteobacteria bacterium]|nr:hypothetical protein [Deltaproteobacteria bacterium]
MLDVVLVVHSWLRWAVLGLGVWVIFRAVVGMTRGTPFGPMDRRAGLLLSISVDVQVLLGLLLYLVLSPTVGTALSNMKVAMKEPVLRFFAVEHIFLMLVVLLLVHAGTVLARRKEGAAAHKTLLGFTAAAFVAVVLAIPWPWSAAARPLLRLG